MAALSASDDSLTGSDSSSYDSEEDEVRMYADCSARNVQKQCVVRFPHYLSLCTQSSYTSDSQDAPPVLLRCVALLHFAALVN